MEQNEEQETRRGPISSAMAGAVSVGVNMLGEKFTELNHNADSKKLKASANFPMIRLLEDYEIEKIAEGLTYPTSVTWDDQGSIYVAEAGGTFLDEEDASERILRVEANGMTTALISAALKK